MIKKKVTAAELVKRANELFKEAGNLVRVDVSQARDFLLEARKLNRMSDGIFKVLEDFPELAEMHAEDWARFEEEEKIEFAKGIQSVVDSWFKAN